MSDKKLTMHKNVKLLKSLPMVFYAITIIINIHILNSQEYYPLNQEIHLRIDRELSLNKSTVHTSFRPLLSDKTAKIFHYDSLLIPNAKPVVENRSWTARKLLSQNFIIIDSNNFKIYIDPIFEFNLGKENNDNLFINSRGININAKIYKNLWIYSGFIETQARYPSYVTSFIQKYGVAPGQDIVKDFKENAYDYTIAYGSVSYSPFKFLNIQTGQGKHFIGDGYRSLFLSDNSFQYPYLKFTANYENFQYVSMATLMQNISTKNIVWARRPWESPFIKKPVSFNYLTYNLKYKLQLGLFEGIVYKSPPDKVLSLKYFNPIILTRSIKYTLDGENNTVIGLNIKYQPFNKITLYGQLVIDDIKISRIGKGDSKNRTGFQAGLKIFDPFKIKNLIILEEFNQVRPYTYTHEFSRQTYTAYNQAIAHPLGANFNEYISIIDYRYKRWHANFKMIFANYGEDNPNQDWGQNIFKSDYYIHIEDPSTGIYTGQGKYTGIYYYSLKASYVLNPKTNLNISCGYNSRTKKYLYENNEISSYYFISISTNLFNQYLDF